MERGSDCLPCTCAETVGKSEQRSVPTLYLAGKIGKNDWRHVLIPRLRNHTWGNGSIETDSFFYVGPFFISCDHSCGHSPGEHGMAQGCTDLIYTREEVINLNMAALANTDLVFAYITAPDCHGTIMEIGWAIANGKRVVMAFAPEIIVDDFWFSSMQCASVHHDVRPCCLADILAGEVAQTADAICHKEGGKP